MNTTSNISNKRFTLADSIIVAVGMVVVASLAIAQWQPEQAADQAVVYNSRGEKLTISLLGEHVHDIPGRLGNSTLEVKDGRIRFLHSPCRGQVCIHAGWLKESGEAAACLPNGVSVVLHGHSPRYDSINF